MTTIPINSIWQHVGYTTCRVKVISSTPSTTQVIWFSVNPSQVDADYTRWNDVFSTHHWHAFFKPVLSDGKSDCLYLRGDYYQ